MERIDINELNAIKYELQQIINELDSISNGVKNDFSNVGNNICALRIKEAANNYRNVLRKLNSIDTNKVTAEFASRNSW